jgi:hypothetical protein
MRVTMSGTHQAPFSAIEYLSAGWRSKTPLSSSTQNGRAAHHQASAA